MRAAYGVSSTDKFDELRTPLAGAAIRSRSKRIQLM